MNANIFSCTVPPLLVLETQIIHLELLQSLCINPCVPLGSISFAKPTRLRAPLPICAHAHPSVRALTRLCPHAPVCCVPSRVCTRTHPSACALRQRGFRFDTSASLKLPKVKKKIGKKNFTRRCPPKENG